MMRTMICAVMFCEMALLACIFEPAIHGQQEVLSEQEKGSSLFQACKANIRVVDSNVEGEADHYYAYRCVGYLQGFMDTIPLSSKQAWPRVCIGGATIGTLARVYVKFIEDNPKYLDMHRGIGFIEAMRAAYPCAN